jgi:general stress protein 26
MHTEHGDPAELRHRFWKAMGQSPFVMLQLDADPDSAAPMTAQLDPDASHEIWFFVSRSSHLAAMGPATATFTAKGHDTFARFHGMLSEEISRERKAKQWSKLAEAWFPGGQDDPDLLMLHMKLGDATIWAKAEIGTMGKAKMALGMDVRKAAIDVHAATQL